MSITPLPSAPTPLPNPSQHPLTSRLFCWFNSITPSPVPPSGRRSVGRRRPGKNRICEAFILLLGDTSRNRSTRGSEGIKGKSQRPRKRTDEDSPKKKFHVAELVLDRCIHAGIACDTD